MKKVFILLLKFYKKFISPIFYYLGVRCKYEPTCSEYMGQAIEKYGVVKGIYLGTQRFIRCNPSSKGGYDPLK